MEFSRCLCLWIKMLWAHLLQEEKWNPVSIPGELPYPFKLDRDPISLEESTQEFSLMYLALQRSSSALHHNHRESLSCILSAGGFILTSSEQVIFHTSFPSVRFSKEQLKWQDTISLSIGVKQPTQFSPRGNKRTSGLDRGRGCAYGKGRGGQELPKATGHTLGMNSNNAKNITPCQNLTSSKAPYFSTINF